ncbi:hypothetical protein BK129_01640 [Paenibacillus amylolyticus]|uniref:hypothetical protein n=1 Tax=Paenibacillus amylolyticus TaxID=1451 RepID=UPI00096D62B0|nr:hypothetical protein [Paenibacillus amylolyticus]OMF09580.1 hypothetical protein BK129_01640 [Paenibacillus amylolyticus]
MSNQRRELRKRHNEICRKILDETNVQRINELQVVRKEIEAELQRTEGEPTVKESKKKPKRHIGNCPLCFRRIEYGESYVQAGKLTYCNDRHLKEYKALINEK